MGIPKEIASAAARLKEGRWIKRITVRQLLKMFKAERRGMNKVQDIRTTLDEVGLETDPDFESAWIDSLIRLRLKSSEGTSSETAVEAEPGDLDEGSDEEASFAEEGAESSTGDVATVQEAAKVSITASVE